MQDSCGRFVPLGLSIVIIFTLSLVIVSFAQNKSCVEFFPTDSKPYGFSYKEHIMKDWKRVLSIPISENPVTDMTGDRCAIGQNPHNSSLFYLEGESEPTVVRTCKIPSGLGLFISC